MKAKAFIDNLVRPLIGDGMNTDLPQGSVQSFKYSEEFLLDMLNETMYDIAKKTDFFRKQGVAIATSGTTHLNTPADFFGLIESENTSTGAGYDTDKEMADLSLLPTPLGLKLSEIPDSTTLNRYGSSLEGATLSDSILNGLVESGYINPDDRVVRDIGGNVLIEYWYKALPPELHNSSELSVYGHRGLLYTLRWGIASKALWGNLHNEAFNVAKVYYDKYKRMRDDLGHTHHNWNSIATA